MIGVNPWYCSCLVLNDIDPKHYEDTSNRDELCDLVYKVALEALESINSRVYYPNTHNKGLLCQRLSLKKVLKAYGLRLDNLMEQIQVEFSINESSSARFEVYAVVGTESGGFMMKKDSRAESFIPYLYRDFKSKIRVTPIQIIGISRRDAYAGPCENLSRSLGYKAEYCICYD
jgi:hypothetical protein